MNETVNKIRLNKGLWFTVLGNKIVFGNSITDTESHYTISFGNHSGHFDLHLTSQKSNEHFTVFRLSHLNVIEFLPQIFNKIVQSVLDLEIINDSQLTASDTVIYKFSEIDNVLDQFSSLVKKDKLIIDKDSEEFKVVVDKLVENSKTTIISLKELKEMTEFTGLLKTEKDSGLIVKNLILGDEVYLLKNVNLDINLILENILGRETYLSIMTKINEGIETLKEKDKNGSNNSL